MFPEDIRREASRWFGHLLDAFDAQEQWLYPELHLDVPTPHPISKPEPSHPVEESHYSCLYLRSYSFNHCPKVMTTGKGWNSDPSSPQRSSTTPALLLILHQTACPTHAPYSHHSSMRSRDTGQQLPSNLEGAIHRFLAENHGLILEAADSHSFPFVCKLK